MQVIYGHRGASGYAPENTLEAFELAAKMGAYGVELDVHVCKDGELIVAHDETHRPRFGRQRADLRDDDRRTEEASLQ